MQTLEIHRPDDWHLHLRDGTFLQRTVTDAARQFARALIMPNLELPITTLAMAEAYRERILSAIPDKYDFTPLMTLYLTDQMDKKEIEFLIKSNIVFACKLYPANVTTHASFGIRNIKNLYPLFEMMQNSGLVLAIHGELADPQIDIFDREKFFIENELKPLIEKFPQLRIVLEHISSVDAVDFVKNSSSIVAATITPHHLLLNRNDLLADGIKPHYYCKPIVKTLKDQQALIDAAISGNPKFFLGTDSAPHSQKQKESACGCAGIYNSFAAMEFYAQIFEKYNALPRLDDFASKFGADFYGLPRNTEKLLLEKQSWQIPKTLSYGNDIIVPFYAQQTLDWKIKTADDT